MSREIKFRAWNVDHMLRDTDMFVEFWGAVYDISVTDTSAWDRHTYLRSPKPVLMEWTGLKDINGTEIYEGDVLQFSEPGDAEEHTYWRYDLTGKPVLVEADNRGFYPFTACSAGIDMDYRYPTESQFIEIIGNIYENPELLTEKAAS